MSVLVYIDHHDGQIKKSSLEAASYAAGIAELMGGQEVVAAIMGNVPANLAILGEYGVNKVYTLSKPEFSNFDAAAYSRAFCEIAQKTAATVVVLSHNSNGKSMAGRVSARLNAGLVSGVIELPTLNGGFKVRKSVFSGKAFVEYDICSPVKVISLNPNSFALNKRGGTASIEEFATSVGSSDFKTKVIEVKKLSGDTVPLPEAELVVSAGRGMKGPENWYLVEDLAAALGAATACSRPVADVHWRPHHEHVGQTGITIRPNLYIAIGISGAIQHLAGVNNSKVIVVINKDPEAPFFKAADYGIVGDALEILPRLTQAVKKMKAEH